ncbi:hypothetical protein AAFN47_18905 [Hoeflea sp. CAU 1731]
MRTLQRIVRLLLLTVFLLPSTPVLASCEAIIPLLSELETVQTHADHAAGHHGHLSMANDVSPDDAPLDQDMCNACSTFCTGAVLFGAPSLQAYRMTDDYDKRAQSALISSSPTLPQRPPKS